MCIEKRYSDIIRQQLWLWLVLISLHRHGRKTDGQLFLVAVCRCSLAHLSCLRLGPGTGMASECGTDVKVVSSMQHVCMSSRMTPPPKKLNASLADESDSRWNLRYPSV